MPLGIAWKYVHFQRDVPLIPIDLLENMYILQRGTFRNSMKIRVFPKGRPLDLSENTHISQGVYLGIA